MSKGYRPAPGRPPPQPPTTVSVEPVETPKPIAVSVDIPLKPDEELENTEIKLEVATEKNERVEEAPLKLEEEPEEIDKVVEETKIEQGPKGLLGAYWISYHNPCHPGTHLGPADLRWSR
jgi:hypothetical protein